MVGEILLTRVAHRPVSRIDLLRVDGEGKEATERGLAPLQILIQRVCDQYAGNIICSSGADAITEW